MLHGHLPSFLLSFASLLTLHSQVGLEGPTYPLEASNLNFLFKFYDSTYKNSIGTFPSIV